MTWSAPTEVVHQLGLKSLHGEDQRKAGKRGEQGQGLSFGDAVREVGITQQSYYRWRRQYGGMSRDQLKRLKELKAETNGFGLLSPT